MSKGQPKNPSFPEAADVPFRLRYVVTKKFKYGGRWLQPGEEFVPAGGKYDDAIVKNETHVRRERIKPRWTKKGGK